MAKRLPLLTRVDIALGRTTSDTEKNEVFVALYEVVRKIDKTSREDFYFETAPKMIHEINPSYSEDKELSEIGRRIYSALDESIRGLIPDMSAKGVGKREKRKNLERAMEVEYRLLNRLYEENINDHKRN